MTHHVRLFVGRLVCHNFLKGLKDTLLCFYFSNSKVDFVPFIFEFSIVCNFKVFFSVLMGAMNLGQASPYMEAFSIARGSATTIFSIIDRSFLFLNYLWRNNNKKIKELLLDIHACLRGLASYLLR